MGELTFHLKDFDGPLELLLALVQAHKKIGRASCRERV